MKILNRVLEYLIITMIITMAYYSITIPFALFVWEFTEHQFYSYVWQGLLIDLGVAYPVGKFIIYLHPKVKKSLNL